MLNHRRSILLNILLITIIVKNINCPTTNGRGAVLKRKEIYQKRNENINESAYERTLKKLSTEHDRLLLIVCKAKCLKERTNMAAWLSEYNKKNINIQNLHKGNKSNEGTTNISKSRDQPLGIHVHYYQKSFPIAEIEKTLNKSSKQVVAFYAAGGKVFQMPDGHFTQKKNFLQWLMAYEQPANIKLLKEAIELDEWLNSGCNEEVTRRSPKQTVLLAVHDIEICPDPLLKNFARSFMERTNYVALELRRPLSEESEFILKWRLKGIGGEMCRVIVLLRGNGYMEILPRISGPEFYQIVSNLSHVKTNRNCTVDLPQTMQEILPQLNPIELEFFKEEQHLKSIEQNRQYLTVGTIGGVAVVALAMLSANFASCGVGWSRKSAKASIKKTKHQIIKNLTF
ncbi:hypothetical protein ACQ4LE_010974 [Meloidogyne hapla]